MANLKQKIATGTALVGIGLGGLVYSGCEGNLTGADVAGAGFQQAAATDPNVNADGPEDYYAVKNSTGNIIGYKNPTTGSILSPDVYNAIFNAKSR